MFDNISSKCGSRQALKAQKLILDTHLTCPSISAGIWSVWKHTRTAEKNDSALSNVKHNRQIKSVLAAKEIFLRIKGSELRKKNEYERINVVIASNRHVPGPAHVCFLALLSRCHGIDPLTLSHS